MISLGNRRVSIIIINFFYFILFCKLLFGDHRWGVDALFHIYHMKSFNYDAKEARDVGFSCRCHLSNSIFCVSPDSIFCVKYVRENNLIVILCKFVYLLLLLLLCFLILFLCLFIYLFVFLVVIRLFFSVFFFSIFHRILMWLKQKGLVIYLWQ